VDAQGEEGQSTFYKIIITTPQSAIFAHGKNVPLRPGLALTVELVTERKSLLALLLEPFRKLKGEP
jgi:membrane fusion protein